MNNSNEGLYILACVFIILCLIVAINTRQEKKKKRLKQQQQQAHQEYVNRISAGNYQTPYEYEQLVGLWLKRKGYQDIQITQKSGDYGADIICKDANGQRIAVQCKLYKNPVGYKAIEEVLGAMHYYNCNHAMVVTNNSYTKQAVEAARKVGVELWSGVYKIPQLPEPEPEQKKKGRRKQ